MTDGFTATPATMLFDCLNIPLCHGWLADEEVGKLTVNFIYVIANFPVQFQHLYDHDTDYQDLAGALSHSFEALTWAVKESHFPNGQYCFLQIVCTTFLL